jgi:hypothetical protein
VDVRQLAPGLWYWTAAHANWRNWPDHDDFPAEVGCVYFEAADATVLVDPLVPDGEEDAFFEHLDRDVERRDLPVRILLTAPWHRRSSEKLAKRYAATLDPHPLPDGVEEIPIRGADERQVAYFIRPHRALFVGEVFAVDRSGKLDVRPSPALTRPDELRESLVQIQGLPAQRLLVAHGEPVLTDAQHAIARAIANARL